MKLLTFTTRLIGLWIFIAWIMALAGLWSVTPLCLALIVCMVAITLRGAIEYVRSEVADWNYRVADVLPPVESELPYVSPKFVNIVIDPKQVPWWADELRPTWDQSLGAPE